MALSEPRKRLSAAITKRDETLSEIRQLETAFQTSWDAQAAAEKAITKAQEDYKLATESEVKHLTDDWAGINGTTLVLDSPQQLQITIDSLVNNLAVIRRTRASIESRLRELQSTSMSSIQREIEKAVDVVVHAEAQSILPSLAAEVDKLQKDFANRGWLLRRLLQHAQGEVAIIGRNFEQFSLLTAPHPLADSLVQDIKSLAADPNHPITVFAAGVKHR